MLDTNVVLDLLYFCDRRCAGLAAALKDERVQWLASDAMLDELERVLERGLRGPARADAAAVREGWRRWARMVVAAALPLPSSLRCTDADDQKFIDFALQVRAATLLSADRAVLKLARRASAYGLQIASVADWRLPPGLRADTG